MRTLKLVVALALVGASVLTGWTAGHHTVTASPYLSVQLDVSPLPAGRYLIQAVIRDIESGEVLSVPKLETMSGETATVNIGLDDVSRMEIGVRVDAVRGLVEYTAAGEYQGRPILAQKLSFELGT